MKRQNDVNGGVSSPLLDTDLHLILYYSLNLAIEDIP